MGNLRVLSWQHHVVRCRAFEFQCAVEGPGGIACQAVELKEHESIDPAHREPVPKQPGPIQHSDVVVGGYNELSTAETNGAALYAAREGLLAPSAPGIGRLALILVRCDHALESEHARRSAASGCYEVPVASGIFLKVDAILAHKLQRVGAACLVLSNRETLRCGNCSGRCSLVSGSDGLCGSFALRCIWNSVFGLHALVFGHWWRRRRWGSCWRHEDLERAWSRSSRS